MRPHLCLTQHSCSPESLASVPRRPYALAPLTPSRSLITCHRLREASITCSIKKNHTAPLPVWLLRPPPNFIFILFVTF